MPQSKSAPTEYEVVNYPEPHPPRTAAILKAHPEIRGLMGRNPATFLAIVAAIVIQLSVASVVRSQPWWVLVLAAFTVGAVVSNTCFMLIHEASHSLMFKGRVPNLFAAIAANLLHVIPSAVTFTRFHLVHHRHQGEYDVDADLASHAEAKMIGNSAFMKAIWLAFFPLFQSIRMTRFSKPVGFWDPWTVTNVVAVFAFDAAVIYFLGPVAFAYLVVSTFFAFGLHPLGGRLIQEHFIVAHPQETYSYYGIGNITALNIGYHNEHHDFSGIPWNRLPKVKAIAPEYYDTLVAHRSWTAMVIRFIFDPSMNLYSRISRPPPAQRKVLGGGVGRVPDSVTSLETKVA
jgi:sphingolipid 4-desaturase/C4-monooxygenase